MIPRHAEERIGVPVDTRVVSGGVRSVIAKRGRRTVVGDIDIVAGDARAAGIVVPGPVHRHRGYGVGEETAYGNGIGSVEAETVRLFIFQP